MPSARRIGALLLVLGYIGVAAGCVAWIISYWDVAYKEDAVYQAALAIGIGLAGLACWRWTVASRASHTNPAVSRGPTRWMAAAATVFAAAFAALTYQTYDNHRQVVQSTHSAFAYPHYRLIISGGSAYTVGLLLAAVGFLTLGMVPRMAIDPAPGTVEGERRPADGVTDVPSEPER